MALPTHGYTRPEQWVLGIGFVPFVMGAVVLVVVGSAFERGMAIPALAILAAVGVYLVRQRRRSARARTTADDAEVTSG